jgi:hypothetical protein
MPRYNSARPCYPSSSLKGGARSSAGASGVSLSIPASMVANGKGDRAVASRSTLGGPSHGRWALQSPPSGNRMIRVPERSTSNHF